MCLQKAAGLEQAPSLARGGVFFVPAGTELHLTADPGSGPLLVWGCAVNSRVYAAGVPPADQAAAEKQAAGLRPAELVAAA